MEGFYRRALNERPEARFRSVRELYEEFVALLAPAAAPVAVASAPAEPAPADTQAVVEKLKPIPEEAPPAVAAEAASGSPSDDVAPPAPEPIAAAALPRFEGQGWEAPTAHPRGRGAGPAGVDRCLHAAPAGDPGASQSGNERWQRSGAGTPNPTSRGAPVMRSAAEATGPSCR